MHNTVRHPVLLPRERGRAPLRRPYFRPWGSEPGMDLRKTQESHQEYSPQTQEPCLRLTDALLHAARLLSHGGTQEAGVFSGGLGPSPASPPRPGLGLPGSG